MATKIEDVIKEINAGLKNKYAIYRACDVPPEAIQRNVCPTGCLTLDLAMECGGLPIPDGKIIHIWGDNGSGKTTLAFNIIAEYQRKYPDELAMYFNLEQTYDEGYMKLHGVNIDRLLPAQNVFGGEAIMATMEAVMAKNYARLFVIDSLPGMKPIAELEKSADEPEKIGSLSLFLSQNLPKLLNMMNRDPLHRKSVIIINQPRTNIGQRYGNNLQPMGGQALRYYMHVSIFLQKRLAKADRVYRHGKRIIYRSGDVRSDYEQIGHSCEGFIDKSKVSAASCKGNTFKFRLIAGIGLDNIYDMYKAGLQTGIIIQKGVYYTLDNKKFKGIDALCGYLSTLDYSEYRERVLAAQRGGNEE